MEIMALIVRRLLCSGLLVLVAGLILWPLAMWYSGEPVSLSETFVGAGMAISVLSFSYSALKAGEDTRWYRDRSPRMPVWQLESHAGRLPEVISGWILTGIYSCLLVIGIFLLIGI